MDTMRLSHPEKVKQERLKMPDGATIYYEKYYASSSPPDCPLILLHGASGDTSAWNLIRNELYKKELSSLSIDLRGHGFSDRSEDLAFYHPDNIIKDIENILKKEQIKNFVLVGHCYGSNIAMRMASMKPKGLKGLVVNSSSYRTGVTSFYKKFTPLSSMYLALSKALPNIGKAGQTDFSHYIGTGDLHLGRIMATTKKNTLRSILYTYDNVLKLDNTEDVKNISCPVCLISGKKDLFFPPKTIYSLHKKLKNANIHILDSADHITLLNNPREVSSIIIDFMRTL